MTRLTGILIGSILALPLSGDARASDHDAHLKAMTAEHAADEPVASPASLTTPRVPVTEAEVVYATLGETPVRGFLARPESIERAPGISSSTSGGDSTTTSGR